MISKRPHAANVDQTMGVVENVPGILNVPMSALGKVRHKYQNKDYNKKQLQNMVFSSEKGAWQTFQKELVGAVNKLRFQYRLSAPLHGNFVPKSS